MTRIEHGSPLTNREALKQEIRQEIRGEARRKSMRGCLVVLAIVAAIIAVPLLGVGYLAATSGLADVPVLTRAYYRPVSAMRAVAPFKGQTGRQVLETVALKASFDPLSSMVRLPLTEAELTTVVAEAARPAPGTAMPFPISSAQIALEEGVIELFLTTPRNGHHVPMRFRLRPSARDGQVTFTVIEAVIGGTRLPTGLAQYAFDTFGKGAIDSVERTLAAAGGVVMGVEAKHGVITVIIQQR